MVKIKEQLSWLGISGRIFTILDQGDNFSICGPFWKRIYSKRTESAPECKNFSLKNQRWQGQPSECFRGGEGGWVRQRCRISCVTRASNWYWLTVRQGLLSLQQVWVEGECFYFCFFTFVFLFLPCPSPLLSLLSLFSLSLGDNKKMTHNVCPVIKPQHNQSMKISAGGSTILSPTALLLNAIWPCEELWLKRYSNLFANMTLKQMHLWSYTTA